MPCDVAFIYFDDSNSKINEELITYIDRNMNAVIKNGGLLFRYEIFTPETKNAILAQGITQLPAMVLRKEIIVSNAQIIKVITERIRTCKNPIQQKTEEEMLREYTANILDARVDHDGKFIQETEPTDDEDISKVRRRQQMEELERRRAQMGLGNVNSNGDGNNTPRKILLNYDDAEPQQSQKQMPGYMNSSDYGKMPSSGMSNGPPQKIANNGLTDLDQQVAAKYMKGGDDDAKILNAMMMNME